VKRYEVRLEDPDSDEFRVTTLEAEDSAAARERCQEMERRAVAYRLSDDEVKEAEAAERDGTLAGTQKGRLFVHRQEKPYKVVSVKEAKKD
jgi:hypothetical protein